MKSNHSKIFDRILEINSQIADSWKSARVNGDITQYGIAGGDDLDHSLKLGLLRFGNQLPAVCYSYGISLEILQQEFLEIFSPQPIYDSVKGPDWPNFQKFKSKNYDDIDKKIINEILDKSRWDWDFLDKSFRDGQHPSSCYSKFTINDQINFINRHYRRTPKKVLEIGGGRGEVANFFKKLGTTCISLEPGQYADILYKYTGELFFGKKFIPANPTSADLKVFTRMNKIDQFDTIIFCESIEHVPESDFWDFWHEVKSTFKGLVIIVNWLYYHPIPMSFPEHIFGIDDELYDRLVMDSNRCIYRSHSHLVLEL